MKPSTALIVLVTPFFQACGPTSLDTNSDNSLLSGAQRIFALRPQNQTHVVALVKLKSPAILADLPIPPRGELSNEMKSALKERAETIQKEHENFLAEVRAITSDFSVHAQYRFILNGMAVRVPLDVFEKMKSLANVVSTDASTSISRPAPVAAINETRAAD
jgi:hypothetical protein